MLYLYDILVDILVKADKYQLSSLSFRFTNEINDEIDLFDELDRQKDLDANKEKAQKWTKQIQRKVVSYMTTLDSAFKYITCEVGNATVSYKFQRQFDTKQSMNFETTAEQLSKNYSLGQVTMRVDGEGLLCIDVPLPKDLQVTINVPTLWRAVYGDPDPDWPDNFLNKE